MDSSNDFEAPYNRRQKHRHNSQNKPSAQVPYKWDQSQETEMWTSSEVDLACLTEPIIVRDKSVMDRQAGGRNVHGQFDGPDVRSSKGDGIEGGSGGCGGAFRKVSDEGTEADTNSMNNSLLSNYDEIILQHPRPLSKKRYSRNKQPSIATTTSSNKTNDSCTSNGSSKKSDQYKQPPPLPLPPLFDGGTNLYSKNKAIVPESPRLPSTSSTHRAPTPPPPPPPPQMLMHTPNLPNPHSPRFTHTQRNQKYTSPNKPFIATPSPPPPPPLPPLDSSYERSQQEQQQQQPRGYYKYGDSDNRSVMSSNTIDDDNQSVISTSSAVVIMRNNPTTKNNNNAKDGNASNCSGGKGSNSSIKSPYPLRPLPMPPQLSYSTFGQLLNKSPSLIFQDIPSKGVSMLFDNPSNINNQMGSGVNGIGQTLRIAGRDGGGSKSVNINSTTGNNNKKNGNKNSEGRGDTGNNKADKPGNNNTDAENSKVIDGGAVAVDGEHKNSDVSNNSKSQPQSQQQQQQQGRGFSRALVDFIKDTATATIMTTGMFAKSMARKRQEFENPLAPARDLKINTNDIPASTTNTTSAGGRAKKHGNNHGANGKNSHKPEGEGDRAITNIRPHSNQTDSESSDNSGEYSSAKISQTIQYTRDYYVAAGDPKGQDNAGVYNYTYYQTPLLSQFDEKFETYNLSPNTNNGDADFGGGAIAGIKSNIGGGGTYNYNYNLTYPDYNYIRGGGNQDIVDKFMRNEHSQQAQYELPQLQLKRLKQRQQLHQQSSLSVKEAEDGAAANGFHDEIHKKHQQGNPNYINSTNNEEEDDDDDDDDSDDVDGDDMSSALDKLDNTDEKLSADEKGRKQIPMEGIEDNNSLYNNSSGGSKRTGSTFGAYLNIVCVVIGTGCLQLPYSIRQCGWLGLVMLPIASIIGLFTGQLIIKTLGGRLKNFSDIGERAFAGSNINTLVLSFSGHRDLAANPGSSSIGNITDASSMTSSLNTTTTAGNVNMTSMALADSLARSSGSIGLTLPPILVNAKFWMFISAAVMWIPFVIFKYMSETIVLAFLGFGTSVAVTIIAVVQSLRFPYPSASQQDDDQDSSGGGVGVKGVKEDSESWSGEHDTLYSNIFNDDDMDGEIVQADKPKGVVSAENPFHHPPQQSQKPAQTPHVPQQSQPRSQVSQQTAHPLQPAKSQKQPQPEASQPEQGQDQQPLELQKLLQQHLPQNFGKVEQKVRNPLIASLTEAASATATALTTVASTSEVGNLLVRGITSELYKRLAGSVTDPTQLLQPTPTPKAISDIGFLNNTTTDSASPTATNPTESGSVLGALLQYPKKHTNLLIIQGLPMAIGSITFAYCGVAIYPHVEASMRHPQNWSRVLLLSMITITTFYAIISISGYWAFGNQALSPILDNLPDNSLRTAANILITLHVILAAPIMMTSLALEIETAFGISRQYRSRTFEFVARFIIRTCITAAL
ncbi:hypothetical protein H4219_005978, partial [Mycoemilia scoparia]